VRPLPGSLVVNPLDLYSQNGALNVNLTLENHREATDSCTTAILHYRGRRSKLLRCA